MPILPQRVRIRKVEKLVTNLHDKTEYVKYIRLNHGSQALNHELVSKKVHKVIKRNQNAWRKTYIDMNTELRKKQKMILKKKFFKLINNVVFGKTMENVRKHRGSKLVTRGRRRIYLVSKPNYHTTKFFTEYLLA